MTSSRTEAAGAEGPARPRSLLRERLVYVHVPKCGGAGVSRALAPLFEGSRALGLMRATKVDTGASAAASAILEGGSPGGPYDWEAVHDLRDRILVYELVDRRNRFLWGHVRFRRETWEAFRGEVRWATMLRHPVDRFVSAYLYDRYHSHASHPTDVELEAWLEAPAARGYARMLLTHFAGGPFGDTSPEAVERAVEHLALFDVVGFLDRPGSFEDGFEAAFGVRPELGRRDRGPAPSGARDAVTPALRERITELCRQDIEVYERALERATAAPGA